MTSLRTLKWETLSISDPISAENDHSMVTRGIVSCRIAIETQQRSCCWCSSSENRIWISILKLFIYSEFLSFVLHSLSVYSTSTSIASTNGGYARWFAEMGEFLLNSKYEKNHLKCYKIRVNNQTTTKRQLRLNFNFNAIKVGATEDWVRHFALLMLFIAFCGEKLNLKEQKISGNKKPREAT